LLTFETAPFFCVHPVLGATIQNLTNQTPRISAPLLHQHNYKEIQDLLLLFLCLSVFALENMDRIKVEPDSHEESSLAKHSEGKFVSIKEEYIPDELFSSQDLENVSLKPLLYSHLRTRTQNIPQHSCCIIVSVHPHGHPTCDNVVCNTVYTGVPLCLRIIHSNTYCGYVKPRIIPNTIYNVEFM
jgi:hypothetical protein